VARKRARASQPHRGRGQSPAAGSERDRARTGFDRAGPPPRRVQNQLAQTSSPGEILPLEEVERRAYEQALLRYEGNVASAAGALGFRKARSTTRSSATSSRSRVGKLQPPLIDPVPKTPGVGGVRCPSATVDDEVQTDFSSRTPRGHLTRRLLEFSAPDRSVAAEAYRLENASW